MSFFERFGQILIIEFICVALMIGIVFLSKSFFKNTFFEIRDWYIENVCVTTDINEVLSDEI